MLPTFSKEGSLELISWLETGISETNFCLNLFVSQELKFSQNRQKLGLKMQYFFQKIEITGAGKGLEMVGLWS